MFLIAHCYFYNDIPWSQLEEVQVSMDAVQSCVI